MTALSACQSAFVRLVGRKPSSIFSAQGTMEMEFADLVQEVATDIAKAHDWQTLSKLHAINGNGVDTAFPMPADYDRMLKKAEVHSESWATWRFSPARDVDQWLDLQTFLPSVPPGYWIILGGQFNILPALPDGEQAKFYYISQNIARDKDGNPISVITKDDDVFALDERLLTLGLIWKWRAQKKFDYYEDMRTYEIALSQKIGEDKGSRILRVGPPRFASNVSSPYPWALGS